MTTTSFLMTQPQASLPSLGKRILLVEDNPSNRQLLSEYLQYYGYEVLDVADGSGFFDYLEQFQPKLILLDLKLPGIDGYTLLEQLQQHTTWRRLPVIIVSAFAFDSDRQRALQLGAAHYLVKPVNLNSLKQLIASYFDQSVT